jgi:hypothetical protein
MHSLAGQSFNEVIDLPQEIWTTVHWMVNPIATKALVRRIDAVPPKPSHRTKKNAARQKAEPHP